MTYTSQKDGTAWRGLVVNNEGKTVFRTPHTYPSEALAAKAAQRFYENRIA